MALSDLTKHDPAARYLAAGNALTMTIRRPGRVESRVVRTLRIRSFMLLSAACALLFLHYV